MRNSPNRSRRRNEGKGRSKGWIGRGLRFAGYSTSDIRRCAVQCHANSPYKKMPQTTPQPNAATHPTNKYINAHIDALCAANTIPSTAPTQFRTPRNQRMKPSTAKSTHQNRANTTHPRTPRNAVKEPLPASAEPPCFQWKTATTPTSFAIS